MGRQVNGHGTRRELFFQGLVKYPQLPHNDRAAPTGVSAEHLNKGERHLRIKALGGAVLAAAALMLTAGPASAASSVTPSNNFTTNQSVTLTWSGLAGPIALSLCSKDPGDASLTPPRPADPTFDPTVDCKFGSSGLAAAGTAQMSLQNPDPALFGWACGISSDLTNAPSQADCWVRFANPTNVATAGNIGLPITFNLTPVTPVVPEAPFAILLPTGAAAIAGIGYAFSRRRRLTTAA